MSSKSTAVYPSTQQCEWCRRQSDRIEKGKTCSHKICDRCIIKERSCQSNCPLCWNKNIANFIRTNEICSGKRYTFQINQDLKKVKMNVSLIR